MNMSRRSDWMYDLQPSPIQHIKVPNNNEVSVHNMGTLNIQTIFCRNKIRIRVRHVLYIPELGTNLLSVSIKYSNNFL